ncbi:CHRD domain-containing protein [Knoellia sp. CPCC 206450]|uniref:CHRD domain-containing protein n=1 Tax=Knoellia tibetensis TaxID=3404798 RepID=UPI003B432F85
MSVRTTTLTLSTAALAAVALVVAPVAAAGGRPLTVEMTGSAERPGPGDPDGSGTATFRINPGTGEVCYTLTVEDIAPATAAHVHVAPETDPGPVVIPLAAPTSGESSGCAAVSRELALELIRNPGNYYVNVHNAEFPAGAVRGQLG